MDERDGVPPGAGPRVPGPRSETPAATYRELFSATSTSTVTDEEPVRSRPQRSRRRTRRLLVAALVALLLVLGALGGAWAYVSHARQQPALDALRAGNAEYEPVAATLRLAQDVDDLRSGARSADAAADRIDLAAAPVAKPTSDLERRVRAVLREEAAILRSADALTGLQIESLGQWPGVRDTMAGAESSLDADVAKLGGIDAARSVRTGRGLAEHVDEVVGEFASTSMTDLLTGQLDDLVAATTTAQVRAVAARTTQSGQVVSLALQGVDPSGPQGTRITAIGRALQVLAGLTVLDGDHLAAWPAISTALTTATQGVQGIDVRNAVSAVDGLVARSTQQLAAWRAATAKATARTRKDTAAVTTYVTAVAKALAGQAAADQAATAFLARVRTDATLTSPAAVTALDAAAKARAGVTTALTAITAPRPLAAQHRALVDAADQATAAVRTGYAGTKRTKCGKIPPAVPGGAPTQAPCLYRDTPGWTALASATGKAAQAYAPARKAWDQAVTALREQIGARKLPVKPVV